MATDYEKFYQENRNGLGKPTAEFVTFFDEYSFTATKVLDVGCGQGRDALFIARLGHVVTAIDLSPTGIRDLELDAHTEGLAIVTEVNDIRHYKSTSKFEIILIDRTLHMLAKEDRRTTLINLLTLSKSGSHLLIADEKSNIPEFKEVLKKSAINWTIDMDKRGYLFAHRE